MQQACDTFLAHERSLNTQHSTNTNISHGTTTLRMASSLGNGYRHHKSNSQSKNSSSFSRNLYASKRLDLACSATLNHEVHGQGNHFEKLVDVVVEGAEVHSKVHFVVFFSCSLPPQKNK